MEIEADCIISPESCNKYGVDQRRSRSAERVKDFMDRGLMTHAKVLERFTELLVDSMVVGEQRGDAELSGIKNKFQKMRDPQNGYLSKQRLIDFFSDRFRTRDPWLPDALSGLFDIVVWHASFPFPPSDPPVIDQDDFIRAMCLVSQNPKPHFNSHVGGLYGGSWGPHSCWLLSSRGKSDQDFRRRLFRSLAVRIPVGTATEKAAMLTKLPVARFVMYQPREDRPADASAQEEYEESDGQQVLIVAEEDERCVDLQDVLAESRPEHDRLTMDPFRESYESVLPTLPQQPYYLHEMHIPSPKLANLVRLLAVVDPKGRSSQQQEELLEWIEHPRELATSDKPTYISWREFDSAIGKNQRFLLQSLSSLLYVFRSPVD